MRILGKRSSILIQGLLGGFVSSTATFLHFTQRQVFQNENSFSISRALLLATMAMLLEGIVIVFSLARENFLILSFPLIVQFSLLAIFVFILKPKEKTDSKSVDNKFELNDLIVWKNVFKFSLFMVALIFIMRFLDTHLSLPPVMSSLLLSLFEAHGVLAAGMAEYNSHNVNQSYQIINAVMISNIVSKTFFILRGQNKAIRPLAISAGVLFSQ